VRAHESKGRSACLWLHACVAAATGVVPQVAMWRLASNAMTVAGYFMATA
jgi:hypothetical protein